MIDFNPKDTANTQLELIARHLTSLTTWRQIRLIDSWMTAWESVEKVNGISRDKSLNSDGNKARRMILEELNEWNGKRDEIKKLIAEQYHGTTYAHPEVTHLIPLAQMLEMMGKIYLKEQITGWYVISSELRNNKKFASALKAASINYMKGVKK